MKGIILTVGLLSLSLLASCDYLKSKELSSEKKLELAEKCAKAGEKYFYDYKNAPWAADFVWDDPQYHYSARLNTCLIHIRNFTMSVDPPSYQYNQVIDIFSNRVILYGWFTRDTKKNTETLMQQPDASVPNYTSNEYFARKDKLFSE